jgi:hypothetical protein
MPCLGGSPWLPPRSALAAGDGDGYTGGVEAVLMTGGALVVIVLAFVLLSRAWVRSSKAGGYRTTGWSDGSQPGPRPPEDDEARWHWDDPSPRA